MLSKELLQQIKQIHISTSYLVNEALAGEYASAFKGRGMEFEEVREYHPGDDIRSIDWNVTAKTGRAYVKEYKEERELTLFLMVDMSASGNFGSQEKLKKEVVANLAAILAYSAIRNNDKVGMMLFTTEVERYIPPQKGRGHVWRIIQEILTFTPEHKGTNLEGALDFAGHLLRKKTVLFLISDFIAKGYERALTLASKRHDIIALHIVDPRELELASVGLLELEDAETGETLLVDTSSAKVREFFAKQAAIPKQETKALFQKVGIDEATVDTTKPLFDPLIRLFRQRSRKSRRI